MRKIVNTDFDVQYTQRYNRNESVKRVVDNCQKHCFLYLIGLYIDLAVKQNTLNLRNADIKLIFKYFPEPALVIYIDWQIGYDVACKCIR